MEQQRYLLIPDLELTEVLDERRSVVWRGVDSATGATVVAKLVEPAYESVLPHFIGRQNRLRQRTMATTPGWVPTMSTGIARNGRSYVIRPYYQHGSVADQLKRGGSPWFVAANLALKVATTIGAAHNRGWSFGYLRPTNILYHTLSSPLVAVYGSATRRFDDGTAQFTAPEVFEQADVRPASDVFSIALIFASLIAGREIDHRELPSDVLAEVHDKAPIPILEVIDWGLAHQLQNRFADAAKMARVLTEALHQVRIGATDLNVAVASPATLAIDTPPNAGESPNEQTDPAVKPGQASQSANGLTETDADQPAVPASEDDTGPIDLRGHLDDPTSIPFPPSECSEGPLADLLDQIAPPNAEETGQAAMFDTDDLDPTIDHRHLHLGRPSFKDRPHTS